MPNLDIGKDGIEKTFNDILVGKPGQREIEVNSYGRILREISRKNSTKGQNIKLTIDNRVQEYAQNLLKSHRAGSIVLMNANTGEIYALVEEGESEILDVN